MKPGAGFSAWNFLMYYSNRAMPWLAMREFIASVVAFFVRTRVGKTRVQSTADAGPAAAAAELRSEGCAVLKPLFSGTQLDDIHAYLRKQSVVTNDGRTMAATSVPAGTRMASFPLRTVVECPHLMAAINRPEILSLAQAYLGCPPTISSLRIDWSFPSADAAGVYVQRFHRDYDDWKFFKLFVYLTDVDADSGPHEFARRSHKGSGRVLADPYSEDDIKGAYGKDCIERVKGPRGTTFLVDTWGIHRGAVPKARERMMFQVQYSLLPIYKFRYRPLQGLNVAPVDRYANRLLLA